MQKKQEKRKENLIIIKLLYVYIVTQETINNIYKMND